VYVANDKNEAVVRPIVTGNWVGKNWVVLSGLKAGEKVIIDNIIKLHPAAAIAPHPFETAPSAHKTSDVTKRAAKSAVTI
jgi:membrane fusion protein (multidrug efflux system)